MTKTNLKEGYASVNGLNMYYETYGGTGQPLVLLHDAFSAIGTSFGELMPELARTRQVIAFEMQGHGHTACCFAWHFSRVTCELHRITDSNHHLIP